MQSIIPINDFSVDFFCRKMTNENLHFFAYCKHNTHVHIFLGYECCDIDEYERWKEYVCHGGLYSVYFYDENHHDGICEVLY